MENQNFLKNTCAAGSTGVLHGPPLPPNIVGSRCGGSERVRDESE